MITWLIWFLMMIFIVPALVIFTVIFTLLDVISDFADAAKDKI